MLAAFLAASSAVMPFSGTYTGTKTVIGITVDMSVTYVGPGSDMNFLLTSASIKPINCTNEAFVYDGKSAISIPGINTTGDCLHDALKSSKTPIEIGAISYSSAEDSFTVNAVVAGFLKLAFNLAHEGSLLPEDFTVAQVEGNLWFDQFRTHFGRTYSSEAEMNARRAIFEENLEIIAARNLEVEAFHFINKFTDLSDEEFRATHLGYRPKANVTGVKEVEMEVEIGTTAATVDWRQHSPKVLTAVKDQGQCGSCWAFSATEQIETDIALATGKLLSLSPQQITSCDKTDLGCDGGNTETAYAYVEKAGLEASNAYPYRSGLTGSTGKCLYKEKRSVAMIKGYATISSSKRSEGKMLRQIEKSPMSVCVDATKWQTYVSGVLGRKCGSKLDHCVQAVGYNAARKYWIVRNSWAADWGEDGYIYIKQGVNACGIAMDATIVTGASVSEAAELA